MVALFNPQFMPHRPAPMAPRKPMPPKPPKSGMILKTALVVGAVLLGVALLYAAKAYAAECVSNVSNITESRTSYITYCGKPLKTEQSQIATEPLQVAATEPVASHRSWDSCKPGRTKNKFGKCGRWK